MSSQDGLNWEEVGRFLLKAAAAARSVRELFSKLVCLVRDPLLDLARNGHQEADAQDIVQVALLKVLRDLHTYQGGDPKAWLRAIVVHAGHDLFRRERRHPRPGVGDAEREAPGQDPPQEDVDTFRAEVRAAIRRDCTPAQRECLLLKVAGASPKEIAQILGLELNTVRKRLSDGMKRLGNDPLLRGLWDGHA